MRADIDGNPGIGAQWVSRQTNGIVAVAVKNALARGHAVLPSDMRSAPDDDTSYVGRRTKAQRSYHAVRRASPRRRTGDVANDAGAVDARRFIVPCVNYVALSRDGNGQRFECGH